MTPMVVRADGSGHTILVVGCGAEELRATRGLLEAEGHVVLSAPRGEPGLALLAGHGVHVVVCDPEGCGVSAAEFVSRVRARDPLVQVILSLAGSTGDAGRRLLRELDVQGVHHREDGEERLLLWVDSALKAYRGVIAMEKHRTGLRYILQVAPELHRSRPMDELLQGLLWQVEGLIGAENCFLATLNGRLPAADATPGGRGFVALVDPDEEPTELEIRAGTGRFRAGLPQESLAEAERALVAEALRAGSVRIQGDASAVPLQLGDRPLGVIYLDRRTGYERDRELLAVFAAQATAAIQNSILFSIATTDALTGLHVRSFTLQQLCRTIRLSIRRDSPLSLLMLDLDRFKAVNDWYGHQAGDRALQRVADFLRGAVRDTDIAGRYGGDEFLVVLPDTPPAGALIVAERLLAGGAGLALETDGREIVPLRLSVGIGALETGAFDRKRPIGPEEVARIADALVASADRALYAAKGTGRPGHEPPIVWDPPVVRSA